MFDRLLKLIINGPRLTLVLALGAILGGYLVLQNLAVDVFPDIKVPRVTIQTEAGGLTAEEVEQRITIPIESAVNGLTGVKGVRSSSGGGLSFVWVDFDWSADPDVSRYRVFERLGQVRESLPPGIEPEIAPAISVSGEIMMIALTSSATNVTGLALRELAEYKLRNHLLAIPGIAQVVTMGGNLPEICVGYKPRVLAQYGLGLSDIAEAVSSSCTWASAGYLPNVRGEELPVRQVARADAVDALKSVWVPNEKGEPLTLGALADISLAGAPRRGSASFNGKDAVVLSVQKAPGGNTLELTKAVETALDTFLIPEGVCLERDAYRQRDFINVSIDNGKHMVRDAVLIVILVLGLTLLNVRALLIVLITMPVSIGLGLVFFPWAGLGVNIMTLGGFAVAVGDIVDGAIIYTEIFRRRLAVVTPERVKDELASASKAVTPSVFFSASIIMLVFLPVLFLTGLEGQFFRPLAYAYLIIFASSIVSAFAVTPVLALIFGKRRKEAARLRTADNRSDGTGHAPSLAERLLQAIYTPFLSVAIRFPKSVTLLATIVTGAALWWATGFGSSFLPPFHEDTYTVFVSMVPGTSLDESERVSENVSEEIRKLDGVLSVTRRTGRAERDQHAEPVSASELIVRVDLAKPQNELKAKMNAIVKAVPGASGMIGYPIAHRISAVLSGSAAELSLNIF
ncbi:MAG: efflux RND transporter permease subunit, partial [Kiritimatiellia bacterium]